MSMLSLYNQDARGLFLKLVASLPADALRVNVAALCHAAADGEHVCTDLNVLQWITAVFLQMARVVSSFNYLEVKYNAVREDFAKPKDAGLKSDVENALSQVESALESAAKLTAKPPQNAGGHPWHLDAVALQPWFAMARQAFEAQAAKVYKNCVQLAGALAKEVEDATPRYAHVFQKKLNAALAKKVLLNNPSRKTLGSKTVALHGRLALAMQVRTRWMAAAAAVAPNAPSGTAVAEPDEAEDVDPDLQAAKTIFDAAKTAVSVTTACSVLFEQTGTNQQAEKVKLMSKARPEFAVCLQQALDGI